MVGVVFFCFVIIGIIFYTYLHVGENHPQQLQSQPSLPGYLLKDYHIMLLVLLKGTVVLLDTDEILGDVLFRQTNLKIFI